MAVYLAYAAYAEHFRADPPKGGPVPEPVAAPDPAGRVEWRGGAKGPTGTGGRVCSLRGWVVWRWRV